MSKSPGRVLGIDPGSKRLGFALSDDLALIARPLSVWTRKSLAEDLAQVRALVEEHQVVRLVVGVPYRLDGSAGRAAEKAQALLAALRQAFPALLVEEQDEALSTWEAEERLKERGLLPLDRRKLVDAYAAAVLLQEALDRAG